MSIPFQPTLFATAPAEPEGFAYAPDFITAEEEAALIAAFAGLPFQAYEFRGYNARRRVIYFGWRYVDDRKVGKVSEIPGFLLPLRDRAAAFAGLEPEALGHALINDYEPGAAIGWHRDRPAFGEVVGVSLGAPAPLRFRRPRDKGWERVTQVVEPRSAYRLSGPARSEWQHSIPPAAAQRWSVTFRTLAEN